MFDRISQLTDAPPQLLGDLRRAIGHLEGDPDAAVASMRTCLERLLTVRGLARIDLRDSINAAARGSIPPAIHHHMNTVRVFGNEALHGQRLSKDDAFPVAISLVRIFEWFYGKGD